jgi:glycosyltransferase involved in cell wall biosynthesis
MSLAVCEPSQFSRASGPIAPLRIPHRVCLVAEAAGGGVGRHFLDLAGGLASCGVEVVAIYSPTRCDESFHARKATIVGPHFVGLPLRRSIHPLDALDLSRLIGVIRRHGPFDLIHGHSSKGGALARLAAVYVGTPAVYTPHAFVTLDPTLSPLKRAIYGRIERWLARRTAAIIAVSHDEADHARTLGIDERRLHVVLNGIERPQFLARTAAREQLGLASGDFCVGFVGRLSSQKAPELLVEAMPRLLAACPAARAVIVGNGPLEEELRTRIAELGLTKQILLLGDRVAAEIMPAFDAFCLCSRYEGLPYVLLEALAAGLPIVATAVGGIAACVTEGENGFIVDSRAAALAEALARLSGDVSLRSRLGEESRRRFTFVSPDRMVDETLAVYRKVIRPTPGC